MRHALFGSGLPHLRGLYAPLLTSAPRQTSYDAPSHSRSNGRSPELSSTAFGAQPPDLPPVHLMEMSFAIMCPLAGHRRPHYPVLVHRLAPLLHASFRPASRRRLCASLSLHLHQVVKKTCKIG